MVHRREQLTIKKPAEWSQSGKSQMNDTGAAEHFVKEDHDFERDLEMFVLESGKWRSAVERKKRESYYICKFSTLEPLGLNKTAGMMGQFYGSI